jgi:hypothetical protein
MELRRPEPPTWRRCPGSTRQGPAHRLRGQNAEAAGGRSPSRPASTSLRLELPLFASRATIPPWRPLRTFDDGRQVFIEFPAGIGQGEMPPLFVVGPAGEGSELVNYRVAGRNHMIVDRLFAAAELKLRQTSASAAARSDRTHRPKGRGDERR